MDFAFAREHIALRRMAREFAEAELRPIAKEIDTCGQVPERIIRQLGELGLLGVPFPQEYGGMGAGEIGYCIVIEELSRVCASTATMIGAHIGIGAMAIHLDGTEEQKREYLIPSRARREDCRLRPHRARRRF